jgi:hypothetical protein
MESRAPVPGKAPRPLLAALAVLAVALGACAAPTDAADVNAEGSATEAASAHDGFVYFHGMSHLGFSGDALHAGLGTQSLLAPSLSDAQLQAEAQPLVTQYLGARNNAVVAGYSLGRVSVFRLMMANAPGMRRAVLVDPTYDYARAFGSGIGGGIARAWLDADPKRSLLFVYGDVTRSLDGEGSYAHELAGHPRASLCYVPGDHERFRQPDMVAALVAKDCADLKSRLAAPRP